jgi:hypothetical protein
MEGDVRIINKIRKFVYDVSHVVYEMMIVLVTNICMIFTTDVGERV